MTTTITSSPVKYKKEIYPGLFVFKVEAPEIAHNSKPGQFVEIDPGEGFFLRRPFSIQDVEGDNVEILIKVVGDGTKQLVDRAGDWNIMGPLGNSFNEHLDVNNVLVGGGVGVAPLKFLANSMRKHGVEADFLVGARTSLEIPIDPEDKLRSKIQLATDDGSRGFHGNVVGLLERNLDPYNKPFIYACGPFPMLAALREFMLKNSLEGEFSLENRMACGMGVCQGCAIPVHQGFKLVCHDGPVFDYKYLGDKFWL